MKRGIGPRRPSRYTAQTLLPPVARPRVVAVPTLTQGSVNTKRSLGSSNPKVHTTNLIVKSISKAQWLSRAYETADNSIWSQSVADIIIVRVLLNSTLLY